MCHKIKTIKKPFLCIAYMTKAKAENDTFKMDPSGTKKKTTADWFLKNNSSKEGIKK